MTSTSYHFAKALTADGWASDVRIDADDNGVMTSVAEGAPADGTAFAGIAIPGMANLHSHAFQRGFAGLTEAAGENGDDFWSWRDAMYRFAGGLDPEVLEAIAAQGYVEMLKAGYTSVAEFHYVHHDRDGASFADAAEMSRAILRAAHDAGLGLTLLPVLYMQSGFDGGVPEGVQKRFCHNVDSFLSLLQDLEAAFKDDCSRRLGLAFHSLRAVPVDALKAVLEGTPSGPIHIHAAEQRREVLESVTHLGARPVRWLLDNAGIDARWCVVHATHMDEGERQALAASGTVAGLCPTTEANLGDGIFPIVEYLAAGGAFGVGSDSNISIDPREELRLLEYVQRFSRERRAVLAGEQQTHVGAALYGAALAGGSQALGHQGGTIAVGQRADIVVLDQNAPCFAAVTDGSVLDSYIFSGGPSPVRDVIVAGRQVIVGGRHADEDAILTRYRDAVRLLVTLD